MELNMKKNRMISKTLILRLVLLLLVPLVLSIFMFKPFERLSYGCDNMCEILDSDGFITPEQAIKEMNLDKNKINKFFSDKYLENVFNVGKDYRTYTIKIKDKSQISNLDAFSLNLKIKFQNNSYLISYNEQKKLTNIVLNENDKLITEYVLIYNYDLIQHEETDLIFNYDITISKSIREYFWKTFIFIIGWLVIIRLFRKSYYYIRYQDRD
ncbi:MAG: hypothetical protein ABH828_02070 [archaeon]